MRPIWNVIATLHGREAPEQWVVCGNHRDAWTYGAIDPNSGTIAMLEMARALGALSKGGWKPRRTIVLASWDGEEYGLLGSTEWAEAQRGAAGAQAAAYINVDVAVAGKDFRVNGYARPARRAGRSAGRGQRPGPRRQPGPGLARQGLGRGQGRVGAPEPRATLARRARPAVRDERAAARQRVGLHRVRRPSRDPLARFALRGEPRHLPLDVRRLRVPGPGHRPGLHVPRGDGRSVVAGHPAAGRGGGAAAALLDHRAVRARRAAGDRGSRRRRERRRRRDSGSSPPTSRRSRGGDPPARRRARRSSDAPTTRSRAGHGRVGRPRRRTPR